MKERQKIVQKQEKEVVKREREREHTHREAGRYGETDGQTNIQ